MISGSESTQHKSELLEQLRIERNQREPEARGHPGRWLAVLGVAAAAVAAGIILWLRGGAIAVTAATAIAASAETAPATVLQASGYVTAEREATVSPELAGELSRVYIEEGEYVHRGQVLARLEDSAWVAALDQADAQLAVAKEQLVQNRVELAEARLDFKRDQALIGQHLISQQAFDQARTQVASLAAQVMTQRRNVTLARAGVQAAQVNVNYTVVRAPFSGVVVDKAAQLGEMISPIFGGGGFDAAGIATIVDMHSLEVDVDVNEAYIHRVIPGERAIAVLDAYPNWKIPAHVIAIVPTADKSKATVKVRVAFDQLNPRILPEMGVRVSFLQEKAGSAGAPAASLPAGTVWVPATAVVERDGRKVVFVIEGDQARETSVTPGVGRGDLRAVQGIASGTAVVKSPPAQLDDGGRIAVKAHG